MSEIEIISKRERHFPERDIDLRIVVDGFKKMAAETGKRIFASIHNLEKGYFLQLAEKKKIAESIHVFFDKYYDPETGKVNEKSVTEMAREFIRRIEVISLDELVETAVRVVDESRDEIVLLFPTIKRHGSDLNSPTSDNSNEFMIKLVKIIAKRRGKKVIIVNEKEASDYQEVILVDDAAYSGEQLSTHIADVGRKTQDNLKVKVYLARATEAGQKKVHEQAEKYKKFSVELKVGKPILSLKQALADRPDLLTFYLTAGGAHLLEEGKSFREMWGFMQKVVQELTLTVAETKTPDFLSFPEQIADGMKYKTSANLYPRLLMSD